jgi:oxygen-independent coproporphyrinogen-3 oxidase
MHDDWLTLLDARVPRYTSYPTAPHFHAGIGAARYRDWLVRAELDRPLSLYIHVPFCHQLCWYCGCNTSVTKSEEPVTRYVDALITDLETTCALLPARPRVGHLHFGGGSPNRLTVAQFEQIITKIKTRFDFEPDAELAIEIDPRFVSDEQIQNYVKAGINRVSIGVQDFDAKVQMAIHRLQPYAQVKTVVERLRAAGIEAINFDLIYGLPLQSEASILNTVKKTLSLAPSRIALFGYAHVPWMKKQQKALDRFPMPDQRQRARLASLARSRLEDAYRPIGIDHFARAGDSLDLAQQSGSLRRNFQGYTTDQADTLLAFGPSSISRLPQGFIQAQSDTQIWMKQVRAGTLPVARGIAMSMDDKLRSQIIEYLMCGLSVDVDAVSRQYDADPAQFLPALQAVQPFLDHGMAVLSGWQLTIKPEWRVAARSIAALFDAYLDHGKVRHSAAV